MKTGRGITREKLYKKNPNCCYCGVKTVLLEKYPDGKKIKGRVPENAATIEHIFSKIHPQSYLRQNEEFNIRKIACRKCNEKKAAADEILYKDIVSRKRASSSRGKYYKALFNDINWFDRF